MTDGDNDDQIVPDHVGDIVAFESGEIFSTDAITADPIGFWLLPDVSDSQSQAVLEIFCDLGIISN